MPRRTSLKSHLRAIRLSTRLTVRSLERLDTEIRRVERDAVRQAEPKRKLRISPKRRAQLKLHGAYIGHLRHLKPRQRAEVKAVKAKKGYEAAISLARTMRGG